ncbi:MAG: riboflavin kinase [Planctomycetota bacterium]
MLSGSVGELYGQTAEIAFLRFLRDEQRFPSREALSEAIARDVATARAFFADEA